MGKTNVTSDIANYLQENRIEPCRVSRDTGIAVRKLRPDGASALNATELLVLCEYLQVEPEEIRR